MSAGIDLRSKIRTLGPGWLLGGVGHLGYRFLYTFGLFADLAIQNVIEGVRAKWPQIGTPTALAMTGRSRNIIRGLAETDDAYAARLLGWRDDWKHAGSAYALMRQVQAYLTPHSPKLRIVNGNGTWYTLNSDGTTERAAVNNWNWDNHPELWSRCWLIIYPPAGLWTRTGTWGSLSGVTWGSLSGTTWGTTALPDQIRDIQHLIDDWRSAASLYVNVIVSFDEFAFDPTHTAPPLPDGTWGELYRIESGKVVYTRDPDGIYWAAVAA